MVQEGANWPAGASRNSYRPARCREVSCVLQYPGQDLCRLRLGTESKFFCPFFKKFVPSVDIPAGTVLIDPPDGLFD